MSINKTNLSVSLGAAFAWYDFIIFNIAIALIFPKLFFPDMGYLIPMLVFTIGFFARPLGSLIYGYFGDRFGRKPSLVSTLYLTGLSTVAIGLLPTYEQIGLAATIIVILARIVQTIGFGGEWAASSTLLIEHNAGKSNRGLISSMVSSGWAMASLAAALMFMLVTAPGEEFFASVGWRIPFLLSGFLLVIGVYLRRRVTETEDFSRLVSNDTLEKSPLRALFSQHWQKIVTGALAMQLSAAWIYGIMIFGFSYIVQQGFHTKAYLSTIQFWTTWAILAGLLFWGWFSDRFDRRTLFWINSVASLILFWPVMQWVAQGDIVPAMLALILIQCPMFAVAPSYFSEMFPPSVRQSGGGVTFNLGVIIGGGLLPLAAQSIFSHTGDIMSVAWLFLASTLVGLIATSRLPSHA